MLAKLQSGATGYDVIMPSDYMVQQMIELGMLQNVDVASFPNGKNIAPEFMDVYFDSGRAYTAPYMYGTTGIACNTKLEPECENIKSWKDLFTGNFANVNALKDQVEIVSAALRATGVAATDLCTTDTAKYIAAEEMLAGFKPAVIDNDGGNERMITGQASIRTSWNGDTHRMKMENPDIIFIYPSEGLNFWSDHMAIPVGAPNLDNAKIFMNWMMDPANMAAASNFSGYNNAISGTADLTGVTNSRVIQQLLCQLSSHPFLAQFLTVAKTLVRYTPRYSQLGWIASDNDPVINKAASPIGGAALFYVANYVNLL